MKKGLNRILTGILAVSMILGTAGMQTAVFAAEETGQNEPAVSVVSEQEQNVQETADLSAAEQNADAQDQTLQAEEENIEAAGSETEAEKTEEGTDEEVISEDVKTEESTVTFEKKATEQQLQSSETKEYDDDEKKDLDDPDVTYILKGSGKTIVDGNYFTVPENKSSESNPITIILDNVNRSQEDKSPNHPYIWIKEGNYVIIKLRGSNYIKAGEDTGIGANDGMSAIHVTEGSTVKITSESGDGSTEGSLEAYGGGGKYGGAAIGSKYNDPTGTIIIAGGTIKAYGGHCAAGIGSGRDGEAKDIQITGGDIYAEGGQYAAGIGAGDNTGLGTGGDCYDITISGGNITAVGGDDPDGDTEGGAGIGCSEGGSLRGWITISNATVNASGSAQAAGIGGGEGGSFVNNASVIIKSGDITATGGSDGAGIGGGNGTGGVRVDIAQEEGHWLLINAKGGKNAAGIGAGDDNAKYVNISLRGGKIVSYGGENGAGIGAGDAIDQILIGGTGTIEAYGGKSGTGIGGGNNSQVNSIFKIVGNTVDGYGDRGEALEGGRGLEITAVASYGIEPGGSYHNEAAAIGSGKATNCPIYIANAVLKTRADEQGADIGGGCYHGTVGGTVPEIVINNCEITSSSKKKSAPGIGSGYGGSVNKITITNSKYTGGSIGGGLMDRNYRGLNSLDSIIIDNCTISAQWNENDAGVCEMDSEFLETTKDHGAAGIGSGQFGSIDLIQIKNSSIIARGLGSGAGIGTGGAGGQNFSVIAINKLDVGDVGTIEIENSHVEAYSGCAEFTDMPATEIGYMKINPIDFGGGAGIGSGGGSQVDTINIHDCDYVYAYGYRGSGIGGGYGTGMFASGEVYHLWLTNIDKIEARGGYYCTGIGTGGTGGGINAVNGCFLRDLYIKDCDDITARGGACGAGIGCGYSSRYQITSNRKGERTLTIIDSNVKAYGGLYAAGIGGGAESSSIAGYGGDSPPILIEGKCQIDAYGGDSSWTENDNGTYGGGAGIGGGECGGASQIGIRLTEDETTPLGTLEEPGKSNYYVHAVGGGGAAGIGSGGNDWIDAILVKNSADSDELTIESGAVFAQGGDSKQAASSEHGGGFLLGAGAGIGGGSAESNFYSLSIKGGYVIAKAGTHKNENDQADDIGAGGDYSKNDDGNHRKSNYLFILDGTVVADNIGEFKDQACVWGGSVTGIVNDAEDRSGNPVYQTTLKLADSPNTKVGLSVSRSDYGKDSIYTDADQKLYLYLSEKGSVDDKSQTADVTVSGEQRHYYGYTNTSHTGVLKMASGGMTAADPGTVRQGDDFELQLEDADGWDGAEWSFEVSGAASKNPTGGQTSSPGAKLSLHADAVGTYSVVGETDFSVESEIYWGTSFAFSGRILKPLPDIRIVGITEVVYNGQPAEGPAVSTNSTGAVSYLWYDQDGNALESAPKDAGSYQVAAAVAETDLYESGQTELTAFTIVPADTQIQQNVSIDIGGTVGTAKAVLIGIAENDVLPETAYALFSLYDSRGVPYLGYENKEVPLVKENGTYAATVTGYVPSGTYRVEFTVFLNDGNYIDPEKSVCTYNKAKQDREVSADDIAVTYGAGTVTLTAVTTSPYEMDLYSFDVVSDTADELSKLTGTQVNPTVTVTYDQYSYGNNEAKVNVHHAGTAVIRIRLRDNHYYYNDCEGYVTVTVNPANLKVSSYAYEKTGNQNTPVTNVSYGKLNQLNYGLKFDGLTNGDTAETFTHGLGTLEAVPVIETVGVSETPYEIGIAQVGAEVTTDSGTKNIFHSRDYRITYDTSTYAVSLLKAPLAVQALDTSADYGCDAPAYQWGIASNQTDFGCSGLVSWDREQDVFSTEPTVTLDTGKTAGKDFPEIAAGVYDDALALSGGVSNNYEIVYVKGTLTVNRADISDASRLSASVEDTVYNGTVQRQSVSVTDSQFDSGYVLKEGIDYNASYPENTEDLTYAGTVTVTVTGIGNYQGTLKKTYEITPCAVNVSTDSAEKIYDGTPLTASGSISGIPDADINNVDFTVTGSRTEVGRSDNTYSLEFENAEMENSYTVTEDKIGMLIVASNNIVDCFVSQPEDTVYNGLEQKQAVTVKNAFGTVLTEGTDYVLDYSDIKDEGGSSSEIKDAGKVILSVTGVQAYTGSTLVTYQIAPASYSVETDSASKEYDGTPLTAGGELRGLVNGETASLNVTGTITDPGSVPNTYEIDWNGTAKESNYEMKGESVGTLIVFQNSSEQNSIIAENYFGTYDGTEHQVEAYAVLPGSTLTYSCDGGETWTSEAPAFKDAMDTSAEVMIHAENDEYVYGTADAVVTFSIGKAALTVKTESATKEYDGTALTAGGSIGGLVNGDTASLITEGSVTNVGSVSNSYEIQWNGTAKDSNYELVGEEIGTLTITPDTSRENSIDANDYQGVYDGTEHAVEAEAALEGSILSYSLDNGVTWSSEAPVFKDAMTADAEVLICAENANYVNGTAYKTVTFRIGKASLTVKTESATKEYDGKPLTAGGTMEGLVNGETAPLVISGSITDVGEVPNTYEIQWNGTAKESNYQVSSETLGTLTVKKNTVLENSVIAEDYSAAYDGKKHAIEASAALEGSVLTYSLDNGVTWTSETPVFKDALRKNAEVLIRAENANYEKGTVYKTVKVSIEKAPLTVKTESATKEYDGTPLTAGGTIEGLLNGETATLNTTGTITEIGAVSNGYEIQWDGSAKESNYQVTSEEIGTLRILPDSSQENVITAKDYSGTYDGKEHTIEAKASLEGSVLSYSTNQGVTWSPKSPVFKDAMEEDAQVLIRAENPRYEKGTAYKTVTVHIGKAGLTVKTESATKEYDGKPLTAGGSMEGLLSGETASVVTNGSITNVGKASNTYEIQWDGTAKESNYEVTAQKLGTLTITPDTRHENSITAKDYQGIYDGTEHTIEAKADLEGSVLSYSLDNGVTWTSEAPLFKDALRKAAEVLVRAENANYEKGTAYKTVKVSIEKAPLTVKTESATKEYDGTALTAGGTIEGLVNGETAALITNGTITDAGSVPNTCRIKWDGTAKRTNYQVTKKDIGTLTITPDLNTRNGVIADGYQGVYDGKEHSIEARALLEGSTISYSTDQGATWSSEAPVFKDAMTADAEVLIRAENPNYEQGTAVVSVFVRVEKAPLTVRTESAEKEYDGTILKASGTIEGLVNDETAALLTTGYLKDAGSVPNTYRILWNGTAVQSNYEVTKEEIGTLTVNPKSDEQNGVISDGYHGVYDGQEHSIEAKALLEGSVLSYSIDGGTTWTAESPVFKDVMEEDAEVMIRAENSNYAEGTAIVSVAVHIDPAPLSVETESATKEYDGTPLTAGGTIDGLVNGETASVVTGGSVTNVGSVSNSYEIQWDGTAKESNYQVTDEDIGTLTVTKNSVLENGVSAEDYTGIYDGTEHIIEAAAVLEGSVLSYSLDNGVTWTTKSPVFKDALRKAAEVLIRAENANYEKGTAYKTVKVRIEKAPLKVKTESATKEYDGTPLTAGGTLEGLIMDETASVVTKGTITEVGSVSNPYEIQWDGTAKESNYEVTEEEIGTLEIKPSSKGENSITAEGYSGTYDGKEHTITAKASLEGSVLTYSTDGGVTWTKEAPVFTDATEGNAAVLIRAENPRYEKGTAEVSVTVSIAKAVLTVQTESAEKVYDGTALTASGSMEGLVNDETALFIMTGSQTEIGKSLNTYKIQWNGTAKESNYQVDAELGTLTVKTPEINYYCREGSSGTWTKGSGLNLTFVYERSWDPEAAFSHFKGLKIDGKDVDPSAYTAVSGSVKITLSSAYLEKLSVGTHTITPVFDDASAETVRFTVKSSGSNTPSGPKTGDPSMPWLWVLIMIGTGTILAVLLIIRKKKHF